MQIEILITYLNGLAEYLENDQSTKTEFIAHCEGALGLCMVSRSIDNFEYRYLRDQMTDIANREYTRFSDPNELEVLNEPCGYDLDPQNEVN